MKRYDLKVEPWSWAHVGHASDYHAVAVESETGEFVRFEEAKEERASIVCHVRDLAAHIEEPVVLGAIRMVADLIERGQL